MVNQPVPTGPAFGVADDRDRPPPLNDKRGLRDLCPWPRYAAGVTRKIAISLPDATLGKARAAAKDSRAASLSSYIGRLIEDASATETFEEMLAAWVQESGATSAEIRAAEEESLEAFKRAGLSRRGNRREKAARKAG